MKKLLLVAAVLAWPLVGWCGKPLVAEAPVNDHGTSGCVSISTSAWTAVPTSASVGRTGIYVTVYTTATANMAGNLDSGAAITVYPIILKPGITQFHGLSDQEPLYLLSLHTGAENACYVEVEQ